MMRNDGVPFGWAAVIVGLAGAWAVAATATVRVDGRGLAINGQATVPVGLFGVHAVPITPQTRADLGIECFRQINDPGSRVIALDNEGKVKPQFEGMPLVIDCQGDRYISALVLTNRNFVEHFRRAGREYGQKTKAANYPACVEFWNEPYLNWASRSHGGRGSTYQAKFYDVTKAVDGGPVTIKGWDKPLDHLRWRRLWGRGEDGAIYFGVRVPEGLKAGDTFRGRSPATWYWTDRREQTFTVVEEWHVHDPTQVAYWSGEQNLQFYLWMFLPFAEEVKKANPAVTVIGGWDYHHHRGNWSLFRQLTVPVIDQAIQWLDGVTEHHYGTDARTVEAWYEVVTAYGMSRHGKWLRNYNTEAGEYRDPALYGREAPTTWPSEVQRKQLAAASYHLRDILNVAHHCPDKVGSRTAHQFGMDSGPAYAMRLLKDLRGPMLNARAEEHDVWPVACINGNRLVVAVHNDNRSARDLTLRVSAPPGMKLQGGRVGWIEIDADAAKLKLVERPVEASGGESAIGCSMPPQQAVRFVFDLVGDLKPGSVMERRQYFAAEGVLHEVKPGREVTMTVKIDASELALASEAALKLVIERVSEGEATVLVGGTAVAIPPRAWTVQVPLAVKSVQATTELRFRCAEGGDGYQVDMASVVIEREQAARATGGGG